MATADRTWRLLVAVPVVAAVAVGAGVALRPRAPAPAEPAEPAPLAVEAASSYDFHDLATMVGASELVVRGRVASTSRGRAVGGPESIVISRVVTVEVSEVLAGSSAAATVLVEEEGWLPDGTPLEVNGLAPSHEGLEAIWFLDELPDGDLPAYLVINHQGRYDIDGAADALRGAELADPLVEQLEGLGLAGTVR